MKQFTKTVFLLCAISSFILVNAQTQVKRRSIVQTDETLTTNKDSAGVHEIRTIQKDSIVGDSIYRIKMVNTKTVAYKGNSKVTTEISSTSRIIIKKE